MIQGGCKDCKQRSLGCHANCEQYKRFKSEIDSVRERRHRQRELDNLLYSPHKYDKLR